MSEADGFRRKADDLLLEAARAENMKERGRLIDEALRWRSLAMDDLAPLEQLNDNDDWDALDALDEKSGSR